MYVTRRLSEYRRDPSKLSTPPPRGHNFGSMVIMDQELEGKSRRGWVEDFPFPQNRILTLADSDTTTEVLFVPVLDQPLSSNRYYVIHATGHYEGLACRCAREGEYATFSCCCLKLPTDAEPTTFDPRDIYHQMEVCNAGRNGFYANSVIPNCNPPLFLGIKNWMVTHTSAGNYRFDDASGLNSSLRMSLPEIDLPMSSKRSTPVVIGNWYSPFIFIKEGGSVKFQFRTGPLFYKITLEQYWEEIYSQENHGGSGKTVTVDTNVEREVYGQVGVETVRVNEDANGFIWFRKREQMSGGVGLSSSVLDGMRWIQKEGGWTDGEEISARVERVEEIKSDSIWRRFCCCVLVESFVLRRMDGRLVLNCDFRHTQHIKCIWE